MALIRGVGLCEAHFQHIAACAAEQETDPGSLSRAVILALLQRETAPATSQERLEAPVLRPRRRSIRPGFYWVRDDAGWTVIQVTAGAVYLRLGSSEEFPLDERPFQRMVPVQQPRGFPWDPFPAQR